MAKVKFEFRVIDNVVKIDVVNVETEKVDTYTLKASEEGTTFSLLLKGPPTESHPSGRGLHSWRELIDTIGEQE